MSGLAGTATRPSGTVDPLEEASTRPGPIRTALDSPLSSYWIILAATALLIGLGLLMVLSASSVVAAVSNGSAYYYLKRQVVFLVIGLPVAGWLAFRSENFLRVIGFIGVIGAIGLLALVLTPMGVSVGGNRAWIDFGFTRLQPSELSKAALVLWSAAVLSNPRIRADQPRQQALAYLPVALLILGLVVAEQDLGTALIVAAIVVGMLWFSGAHWKLLTALAGSLALGVGVLVVTSPERVRRIFGFIGAEGGSTSDQPLNAVYALASGGWFGLGLGESRQKWGPLYTGAQTDYVFAVLGEELGLVGTITVLGLFAALGWAGLRVAMRSDKPFWRLCAAGVTGWLLVQAVVNMAVAMRMLPVVGVPLPFISYGGSALLANLIAVGILLAAARHEPGARLALTTRGRTRPRLTGVVSSR